MSKLRNPIGPPALPGQCGGRGCGAGARPGQPRLHPQAEAEQPRILLLLVRGVRRQRGQRSGARAANEGSLATMPTAKVIGVWLVMIFEPASQFYICFQP